MTDFIPKEQRVHRETLKLIVADLFDRYKPHELMEILNDSHVLQYHEKETVTKESVMNLLIFLTKEKNLYTFLSFLEYLTNPLLFKNNKGLAATKEHEYANLLRENNIDSYKGRWCVGPTEEDHAQGYDYWHDSSGNVFEYTGEDKAAYHVQKDSEGRLRHQGRLMFTEVQAKTDYARAFTVLHQLLPMGGFCDYKTYVVTLKKEDRPLYEKAKNAHNGQNEWTRKILTEPRRSICTRYPSLVTIRSGEGIEYHNVKNP